MKKIIWIFILLLLTSSVEAYDSNVGIVITTSSAVASAAQSTGLLFGDQVTSGLTSGTFGADAVRAHLYTASDTGTLGKAYYYAAATDGDNSKFVVYNSSKVLIATSDVMATVSSGQWNSTTFSGAAQVQITSGQQYYLGLVHDANFSLSYEDAVSTYYYDPAGSYASPPTPLATNDPSSRRIVLYVTGGD